MSRLTKITGFNGGEWNYAYDELGNKASLSRPNGLTTNYGYDSLNRLTDLANVKGSGTSASEVSRFAYRLRADGRRDKLTETLLQPDGSTTSRNIEYSFDDANRLTGEVGQDGAGKSYSKTYTLDEAGNRQRLVASQETANGTTQSTTTNYSYNDLDWMTQQSVIAPTSTTATSYGYDANGSQTGITTTVGVNAPTYVKQQWDFEGHLTARGAVNAQGQWGNARNEYSYNAAGMRLSQSTVAQSGATTNKTSYLWNGDRLLEERDKDGDLLARYEHGQELGPLSMLRPATSSIAAQTRYFIGDGQDSTRQLTDEAGVIKDSYFYDSFGVDLNGGQATTANSFKYTGQQQDASGLYYLRARYYEAGSGRFLSHDPLLGSSDDPITMHRYLYANGDPANVVDPSGRFGISMGGMMSTIGSMTALSATFSVGSQYAMREANDFAWGDVPGAAWDGVVGLATLPMHLYNERGGVFVEMYQWHVDLVGVIRDSSKTPGQRVTAAGMLAGSILAMGKAARGAGAKYGPGAKASLARIRNSRNIARFIYEEEGSVQIGGGGANIFYSKKNAAGLYENNLSPNYSAELAYAEGVGSSTAKFKGGPLNGTHKILAELWAEFGDVCNWVIMPDGELRITPQLDGVRHSVGAGNSAVRAAGEVTLTLDANGQVHVGSINNRSGHYANSPDVLPEALKSFESNGFGVSNAEVNPF